MMASTTKSTGTPNTRRGFVATASPRLRGMVIPTVSPTLMTPGTCGSVRGVPLNDDEAERRIRRRENQLRSVLSPGCHTPRSVARNPERGRTLESGTSTFSNAQIAEHYATCVKLSAENKINAKNAFGLHLIDCMAEMLRKRGEMTNFQVAGCTLDASAKIYAGRVDSIYNDAYKMLGGLGRSDNQGDSANGKEGDNEKKRKTKKGGSVQVIEKNPKSLDVNTFDLEFEVDPLFKKTSAAFDEGGVEGLLLNQLCVDSDKCSLLLDASHRLSVEDKPLSEPSDLTTINTELKELFKSLGKLESLHICPTFADFKFNDNNNGSWSLENIVSYSNTDYCPPADADYSMIPLSMNSENAPVNYDDDDGPVDMGGVDESRLDPEPCIGPPTSLGKCGDTKMLQTVHQNQTLLQQRNELANLIAGELCLTDNIQVSEYSYFNPAVLSTWAGPNHWKLRPRNKDTDKSDNVDDATQKKKRQPRKVFRVDLTATPNKDLFVKGRASTVMSKTLLEKMLSVQTVLPHDPNVDVSVLYKLFSKPKWKIERKRFARDVLEDEDAGEVYNYDNANDESGYVPFGGDVPDNYGDDQDIGFEDATQLSGAQFMSLLSDTQLPSTNNEQLDLNLIAEPRKVTPIQIEYAKQAKKIDVKKLKGTMWGIISQNKDDSQVTPLSFTSLYCGVKGKVSSTMSNELSVPISFVCLLHLANEKILQITSQEDMSDFVIALTSDSPR